MLTALFWVFGLTARGLQITAHHLTVLAGRCLIARHKIRAEDLLRLLEDK